MLGRSEIGSRVEWLDLNLFVLSKEMSINLQNTMGFKIEWAASIWHQVILMLVYLDRDPVRCHLEEIDRWSCVEREHGRLYSWQEACVGFTEGKDDID